MHVKQLSPPETSPVSFFDAPVAWWGLTPSPGRTCGPGCGQQETWKGRGRGLALAAPRMLRWEKGSAGRDLGSQRRLADDGGLGLSWGGQGAP